MNFGQFLAMALALGFKRGSGSSGGGVWGAITGTLGSQTDLNTALSLKTAALGTWNLTTNVATAPNGTTTFTPANGVYPVSQANFLLATGTGTRVLDGNTYNPGDYAVMSPAAGVWEQVSGTAGSIASTTKPLKGGGSGNAVAATVGVDVGAPSVLCIGVGIFIMQAGTVGSNGALTITGTAFIAGFTSGFWGYFPANSLTGSNAAGFYWVVMSSTTAGIVYNTTYTPGTTSATVPASPVAFSGTTGAAYTNTISTQIIAAQVSLGTNQVGPNGYIRSRIICLANTGSTAHNVRYLLNATNVGQPALNGTNVSYTAIVTIQNRGVVNQQIIPPVQTGDTAVSTSNPTFTSVDTSGATTWGFALQTGATSDWVGLVACDVTMNYAP